MPELSIQQEVDRVYADVPGSVVVKSGGTPLYRVERSNLEDVVVWNPWESCANIADFGPSDGYKNMSKLILFFSASVIFYYKRRCN